MCSIVANISDYLGISIYIYKYLNLCELCELCIYNFYNIHVLYMCQKWKIYEMNHMNPCFPAISQSSALTSLVSVSLVSAAGFSVPVTACASGGCAAFSATSCGTNKHCGTYIFFLMFFFVEHHATHVKECKTHDLQYDHWCITDICQTPGSFPWSFQALASGLAQGYMRIIKDQNSLNVIWSDLLILLTCTYVYSKQNTK